MHRTPAEFMMMSRREKASVWACMDIAIEENKKAEQKAKRKSRRR